MCLTAIAQKFEMSFNAGTNLSHFTGSGAVMDSYIIRSYSTEDKNLTNNPYSQRYGIGYAGNLSLKFISKKGIIAGVSSGYEVFKNKVNINGVYYPFNPALASFVSNTIYVFQPSDSPGQGTTFFKSSYVNISAFVGYRVPLKKASLDILPGADYSIAISAKENGTATGMQGEVSTNYERKLPNNVSAKIGAALNLGSFVINASYAHGLKDYYPNETKPFYYGGGLRQNGSKIYTEQFGLGIGYRFPAGAIKNIFLTQ
jgi:hypothetical protein